MIYIRVNPHQSNAPNFHVIDYDNDLAKLLGRVLIDCSNGVNNNYPNGGFVISQQITCVPNTPLNTDIYKIP